MREPERTQAEVQRVKNRKRYVVDVQPMRVFKCAGSSYGTRDMRDAKGNTVPVVMNRAERRRFLSTTLSHVERLARREEPRDHVRTLLRKKQS